MILHFCLLPRDLGAAVKTLLLAPMACLSRSPFLGFSFAPPRLDCLAPFLASHWRSQACLSKEPPLAFQWCYFPQQPQARTFDPQKPRLLGRIGAWGDLPTE
jgi:hypothetical protein